MENKKSYTFTECNNPLDCKEYSLEESELEEKHKNLLLGQLIKDYTNLPKDIIKKFKEYVNESEYSSLEEACETIQKYLRSDKADANLYFKIMSAIQS